MTEGPHHPSCRELELDFFGEEPPTPPQSRTIVLKGNIFVSCNCSEITDPHKCRHAHQPYYLKVSWDLGKPIVHCSRCTGQWICVSTDEILKGKDVLEVVRDMFLEGRDQEAVTIIHEFLSFQASAENCTCPPVKTPRHRKTCPQYKPASQKQRNRR